MQHEEGVGFEHEFKHSSKTVFMSFGINNTIVKEAVEKWTVLHPINVSVAEVFKGEKAEYQMQASIWRVVVIVDSLIDSYWYLTINTYCRSYAVHSYLVFFSLCELNDQ